MYVIQFIDDEEWYLLFVTESAVQATNKLEQAEKFLTELDAKAAACYLPDGMKFVIKKLSER